MAESIDVDRTLEKRTPSSATPSLENPPHSCRLLLSIGVPRPAYFINGQDPRAPARVVADRFAEDNDFFDFFGALFADKGPECEANEMERDRMGEGWGEGGGDGVGEGGSSDVDGVGEEGGDRQDKSKSKSAKAAKMEVSISNPEALARIVALSLSSSDEDTSESPS